MWIKGFIKLSKAGLAASFRYAEWLSVRHEMRKRRPNLIQPYRF